jgi:hypothetical protein
VYDYYQNVIFLQINKKISKNHLILTANHYKQGHNLITMKLRSSYSGFDIYLDRQWVHKTFDAPNHTRTGFTFKGQGP